MTSANTTKKARSDLFQLLDEVEAWHVKKTDDCQKNDKQLNDKILALEKQLDSLRSQRDHNQIELTGLGTRKLSKTRTALFNGLEKAQALLVERDVLFQKKAKQRKEKIATMTSTKDMKQKVADYIAFSRDPSNSLSQIPVGYRKVILQHHKQVRAELDPIFQFANSPLDPVKAPSAGVSVVSFIEMDEELPTALAILLPIPFTVYSDWLSSEESLHHKLFYRINAALVSALKNIGVSNVPIEQEDFEGFLLITVYLGGSKIAGDVKVSLNAELEKIQKAAAELAVVNLNVEAIWLSPEVIEDGE